MPGASSGLPGSRSRTGPARGGAVAPPAPCLALLRVGFAEPVESPRLLVRSYRTVSPLPHRASAKSQPAARRFAFCCTFPGLAAGRCYRSPCPAEPGLSSRREKLAASDHPAHCPARLFSKSGSSQCAPFLHSSTPPAAIAQIRELEKRPAPAPQFTAARPSPRQPQRRTPGNPPPEELAFPYPRRLHQLPWGPDATICTASNRLPSYKQ